MLRAKIKFAVARGEVSVRANRSRVASCTDSMAKFTVAGGEVSVRANRSRVASCKVLIGKIYWSLAGRCPLEPIGFEMHRNFTGAMTGNEKDRRISVIFHRFFL